MQNPLPSQRPIKRRRGARVLVVAEDVVLLVRDTDPGVPGSSWWVLPGGGLDRGEDALTGARRELAEETGLIALDLAGPIAERTVTHGYSDRILIQHEVFFRIDTALFEPQPQYLSPSEQRRRISCSWVSRHELDTLTIWPSDLGKLLAATPERPLRWGDVEESTVPVI